MMNLKVKNVKENNLIGRKEIEFEIDYEKTPKREEIIEMLSRVGNFNKDLLVIKKIRNVSGIRKSVGYAHEYKDEETLNRFEPKYIIKRWKHGKEEKEEKQEAKQ